MKSRKKRVHKYTVFIEQIETLLSDGKPRKLCEVAKELNTTKSVIEGCLKRSNKKLRDFCCQKKDGMINKREKVLSGLDKIIKPMSWHYWFVGLVDGEGCFSVFIKPGKLNYGLDIQQTFSLHFHKKEYRILEDIKKKLKLHQNICYTNNSVTLACRDIVSISTIIVPIFNSVKLKTTKNKDFELFKESIKCRMDRTLENSKRLVEIYNTINIGCKNHKRKRISYNEDKEKFYITSKMP